MRTAMSVVVALLAGATLVAAGSAATAPPTATALPVVSGTPVVGNVLTTTKGTWTGSPTRYAYHWKQCDASGAACTGISGATSASYRVQSADVGHRLRTVVTATNSGGRTNARSNATAVVTAPASSDGTAPSAPSTVTVTASTQTSVSISWGASSDNVGVAGYRLYLDGVAGSTTTGTSYTFGPLACGTTHTLSVSAYDAAGNKSSQSAVTGKTSACSSPPPPASGLHVSGNRLLDASGATVRLHGVNYSGTEYACIQGWGIFDGPSDSAMVKAIASWHANIVHIGLNEDCILGINGVPSAYAGANYMNAVTSFVSLLHANGLYAEVSLMWAAPGTKQALDHPQILDQDHAPAALQAIANAFKGDPKTIIGLQSEPHAITWQCWSSGGSACSVGYTALGMQGALDAVRSTGATNVVTASGIDYANNLSSWLTYAPKDSLGQLMAEAHVYGGNSCASTTCFDANYAPVAASVPMVFGETGETYDSSSCGTTNISTFLSWADAHGVGYEPWVWDTWGDCGSLISSFDGTPANAYATWVRNHFLATP